MMTMVTTMEQATDTSTTDFEQSLLEFTRNSDADAATTTDSSLFDDNFDPPSSRPSLLQQHGHWTTATGTASIRLYII